MKKILLTVPMLASQSIEMNSLKERYDELFRQAANCLKNTDQCLSSAISSNFSNKITSAQKSFQKVSSVLAIGSNAARQCALSFGNTGISKALTDLDFTDSSATGSHIADAFPNSLFPKSSGGSSFAEMLSSPTAGGSAKDAADEAAVFLENLSKKDFKGAVEQIAEANGINLQDNTLYQWGSDAYGTIRSLMNLEDDFKANLRENSLSDFSDYINAMQKGDYTTAAREGMEFGFHFTGGISAVDVAGKNALEIVKLLPGFDTYYKDVNDTAGAIDKVMGDMYGAITGNQDGAAYIGSYYTSRGGLAEGLSDGAMTIGSEMAESITAHGGFFNSIIDGWKSILG